ncbi:16S rRNA (cytosine(1402)-N(4))-methyltransferase RsmH [Candidatus Kuenenbacteria bacterium]|nr:16S rRNA (cytosine(1402)-N(4))-methyltransferase RsmH [Candidatus Kuenenbacteria bacterium]
MEHKPVLLKEVIDYLDPKPNQNFIDCTFGGGGHAAEILQRIEPNGRLLGIDANGESLEKFKIKDGLILINDNFRNLKKIHEHYFSCPIDGVLFDLGLSSIELADRDRGFSFLADGPLDMRFDREAQYLTAGEVLNKYVLENLIKIFVDYGEVPRGSAKLVAEAVVETRKKKPLATVFDFLSLILGSLYPRAFETGKITIETRDFYHHRKRISHPATQFFQALRIEVNDELESIKQVLPIAIDILRTGGRVAVISFHSLEDRIVKNYFRDWARAESPKIRLLTKKPVVPAEEELRANPRSRSAKLRVAEKI